MERMIQGRAGQDRTRNSVVDASIRRVDSCMKRLFNQETKGTKRRLQCEVRRTEMSPKWIDCPLVTGEGRLTVTVLALFILLLLLLLLLVLPSFVLVLSGTPLEQK